MSIFMKYEGIKGESSDQGYKDWIDIENWRWGTRRKITSNSSTQSDRESSNATITDLTISKHVDRSTPKLFVESCCGRGKEVKLHLTKTGTGSGADVYLEYTLKNSLICDYTVGGSAQDTKRPMEHITISFVELEVKYIPYDEDGAAKAAIAVGFDSATNIKK